MKMLAILHICGWMFLLAPPELSAQQAPDTTHIPELSQPAYSPEEGPAICIDAAHNNLHQLTTGYAPFAAFLRNDGYRVISYENDFVKGASPDCRILVIANALHESNLGNWVLPNPSAFTEK